MTAAATSHATRRHAYRASIRRNVRAFWSNRPAVVGVVLIVLFGVMAVLHPILRATIWQNQMYDPLFGFDFDVLHPSSPSLTHWLGTDTLGRDVASQLLAATGTTWVLAVTAAITTAVVATFVGAVGSYYRGPTDFVLQHTSDGLLLLPAPIFMLIIGSGAFSQEIGPVFFGLIYGFITGAGAGAIVIRSYSLQVMTKPFIDAAELSGGSGRYVIRKHLLPHLIPLALMFMMLAVVGAVVADGFASFLGQTRSILTWGTMVYYGTVFTSALESNIPWNALLPPSLALSLFAAGFYLVSVGLRRFADPRYLSARRDFIPEMPEDYELDTRHRQSHV